ncbi:MAG: hypothetical protein LCH57_07705 [Proteobacteria bacterium]|nr:hypothetical protein [Pseudomonadota bacterium]
MSTLEDWRSLCDRLHTKGAAIFDEADPAALDADPRDPLSSPSRCSRERSGTSEPTLHALPFVDADEPAETIELLCSSILNVLVAVNEILGGVDGGERLDVLAETLKDLGSRIQAGADDTGSAASAPNC